MQFLKILFWCLLAFVAALFTYSNWNSIEIHLWSGLVAAVNLPLLLLVTFLIGFLPTYLYMGARRWRLRQRLATCERSLADSRAAAIAPTGAPVGLPVLPATVPSQAVPMPMTISAADSSPLPPSAMATEAAGSPAGTTLAIGEPEHAPQATTAVPEGRLI